MGSTAAFQTGWGCQLGLLWSSIVPLLLRWLLRLLGFCDCRCTFPALTFRPRFNMNCGCSCWGCGSGLGKVSTLVGGMASQKERSRIRAKAMAFDLTCPPADDVVEKDDQDRQLPWLAIRSRCLVSSFLIRNIFVVVDNLDRFCILAEMACLLRII